MLYGPAWAFAYILEFGFSLPFQPVLPLQMTEKYWNLFDALEAILGLQFIIFTQIFFLLVFLRFFKTSEFMDFSI